MHERFVMLFTQERRRIFGLIYSIVPITADAEDIFQQVSLLLWRKFSQFDPDRDFYRWAAGIVHFVVCNYRRSAVKRRMLFSDELVRALIDQRLDRSRSETERTEALRECMTRLPKKDLSLLADIYGVGMSADDVAERIGRQVGTIYNRLSSVRKRLLECIEKKMPRQHRSGAEA